MGVTLSHASALYALRMLRGTGADIRNMTHVSLGTPRPWIGTRWSMAEFKSDAWALQRPSAANKLDVLVGSGRDRLRMNAVRNHVCSVPLPAGTLLWVNNNASIAGPELLFVQMAEIASLSSLVVLGHELCGSFSRSAVDPQNGAVVDGIRPATSVAALRDAIRGMRGVTGAAKALTALEFIADNAVSAPEALLSTLYSLPVDDAGYGMGPITLNKRVDLEGLRAPGGAAARYPDLLFPFAPVGINYDGNDHADLDGLTEATRLACMSEGNKAFDAERAVLRKRDKIRQKMVDDLRRNRELAARGYIVLPATREDLYEHRGLDHLTRLVVSCSCEVFGVDTNTFMATLDDTECARERQSLLDSLLPRRISRKRGQGIV